jgi:geranylgeranyl pyrophosphate synthase
LAKHHVEQAIEDVMVLAPSAAREALVGLAHYAIERIY